MTVLSMPSNPADARFRAPRSPECPNDITDAPPQKSVEGRAGLCGFCAWGFYRMNAAGHQSGEDVSKLSLEPVHEEGRPLGYKAQCGRVSLYKDETGRIGALRLINGEQRFFPGITGNVAYNRYLATHPVLERA